MARERRRKAFDIETSRAIGRRIKEARGTQTQQQFAQAIEVSRATLANYERGTRLPNDLVLKRISAASGVLVTDILFGKTSVPFPEYLMNVENFARRASEERPGFFPRFLISDDELSFIALFRLMDMGGEGWPIVKMVVDRSRELIAQAKQVTGLPIEWGEGHLARLEAALEHKSLVWGFDPDMSFWATFQEETDKRKR